MKELIGKLFAGILTSRKARWTIAGIIIAVALKPLLVKLGVDPTDAQNALMYVIGLIITIVLAIMGEDVAAKWGVSGKATMQELVKRLAAEAPPTEAAQIDPTPVAAMTEETYVSYCNKCGKPITNRKGDAPAVVCRDCVMNSAATGAGGVIASPAG